MEHCKECGTLHGEECTCPKPTARAVLKYSGNLYCTECGSMMMEVNDVLSCSGFECRRIGKKFKLPVFELEEIIE